jgi:hypothetical protein
MPLTSGFKKLKRKVSKTYLNKPVPMKYRKRYGKRYGKKDVESLAYAFAHFKGVKIH